jgi:hypothetical protein
MVARALYLVAACLFLLTGHAEKPNIVLLDIDD